MYEYDLQNGVHKKDTIIPNNKNNKKIIESGGVIYYIKINVASIFFYGLLSWSWVSNKGLIIRVTFWSISFWKQSDRRACKSVVSQYNI